MDVIISISIIFCLLIVSILKGVFVGYPLLLGFFIFAYTAHRRGFNVKAIAKMSYNGGKKAFIVLRILILIGGITSIWMASGTVPAIIYYGIKYMNLNYFILYAFIISCAVSFLIGTSFGTVSTVGISLILIAKSGNVNLNMAAGAIIAGAYFGDRCSPMSSSANLVAVLTKTNLYTNIRNMFRSSIIPFIISIIIYLILSTQEHINFVQSRIDVQIINTFKINWIVLLPAAIILVLSLFKIDVKLSILVSIICASVIAMIFQHYKLIEVVKYIILGFTLDKANPLHNILKGGGIISMWQAAMVVFISCALSGLFDETNMLKSIENIFMGAKTRCMLFIYTTITSIATSAFGCNQAIAIVLTHQLMSKSYEEKNTDNYKLALDLENTGVLLAPLIPWNIAGFIPTMTLGVSSTGFIPYAFYMYLVPIASIVYLYFSEIKKKKLTSNNCNHEI